ncbi:hypothetical protein AALC17_15355 [Oscillospiraceae bacterium 38-13]
METLEKWPDQGARPHKDGVCSSSGNSMNPFLLPAEGGSGGKLPGFGCIYSIFLSRRIFLDLLGNLWYNTKLYDISVFNTVKYSDPPSDRKGRL